MKENKREWIDYVKEAQRPFVVVALVTALCIGVVLGKIEIAVIIDMTKYVLAWLFCERAMGKNKGG